PVLNTLLADNLTFINQDGLVLSKNDDLKVHESGHLKFLKLEAHDQKISLFGDTAIVSVSIHLSGTFSGEEFSGQFKYGRTWKMIDDKLQVIAAQCSLLK